MRPIVIITRFMPNKTTGMALFPFILIRPGCKTSALLRHEIVHIHQQLELLILPFYLIYALEFLIKCLIKWGNAYRDISFEQEAFALEKHQQRSKFGWIKYVFKMYKPSY